MGDWTDEFGWYDDLDRQEQEEERKARRAKLLTPPEPAQKPMHPELRKMWEDYFDKCFREFSAAQLAPVREDWGPGPHEVHSLPPAAQQEYERGVIDGRQMQAQSSVDKAVNAMSQRQWVGLTDEEILEAAGIDGADTWLFETAYAIEAKLKEKNT